MRILLLADCYLPTKTSAAAMISDLAIEMSSQGHEVAVAVPDSSVIGSYKVEESDGVEIVRIRTGKTKGVGHIRRGINEVLFSPIFGFRAKRYWVSKKFDLIVSYSPCIFWGPLVARLKKLWGCRSYLILRDIFPQNAIDLGYLRKGIAYYFFDKMANVQYRVADTIGLESYGSIEYFKELTKGRYTNLRLLRNWKKLDNKHILTDGKYRKKWGLQDKMVFVYGGNFCKGHDVDSILNIAQRLLSHNNLHFVLVGGGSQFERIRLMVESMKITNVSVYPSLSQEDYLEMLCEFDAGIITLSPKLKTSNIPGKLLTYLECGLPMVVTINRPENDLKVLIEKYNVGYVCSTVDEESFADNIVKLVNNDKMRAEIRKNAKNLLQDEFDVKNIVDYIVEN
ncbi:MAG: glycosyltransferase family 4 protein [Phycisphaerae bacterium]|nr:glycosyltransferase family 4 protein [Phycisphaerae bacterium]